MSKQDISHNRLDTHYEKQIFDVQYSIWKREFFFRCTIEIIWYDLENDISLIEEDSDECTIEELEDMLDHITELYL